MLPRKKTHIPHVDIANADDLGVLAHRSNVDGRRLCLLGVAPDDARIGPQVHQRACLGAADVTGTASDKGNAAI